MIENDLRKFYTTHVRQFFIALEALIKFWAANHHDPRRVLLGFLPPLGYLSVFRQLSEVKRNHRLAQGHSLCAVFTNANYSQWGAEDGSCPLIPHTVKFLSCPPIVATL